MIIEVFGPSCAGKTSLIRGVAEIFRRYGIPVEEHDGVRCAAELECSCRPDMKLRDPRLLAWSAANRARASSEGVRQFSRSLALAKSLKRPSVVSILDEGPLKWSSTAAQGSKFPAALAHSIPKPDLAVLLDCDFEVRLARLRATGRVHARSRKDDELRERDLAKSEWNMWISDLLGLNLVRVDTSSSGDWSGHVAELVRTRFAGEVEGEGRGPIGRITE